MADDADKPGDSSADNEGLGRFETPTNSCRNRSDGVIDLAGNRNTDVSRNVVSFIVRTRPSPYSLCGEYDCGGLEFVPAASATSHSLSGGQVQVDHYISNCLNKDENGEDEIISNVTFQIVVSDTKPRAVEDSSQEPRPDYSDPVEVDNASPSPAEGCGNNSATIQDSPASCAGEQGRDSQGHGETAIMTSPGGSVVERSAVATLPRNPYAQAFKPRAVTTPMRNPYIQDEKPRAVATPPLNPRTDTTPMRNPYIQDKKPRAVAIPPLNPNTRDLKPKAVATPVRTSCTRAIVTPLSDGLGRPNGTIASNESEIQREADDFDEDFGLVLASCPELNEWCGPGSSAPLDCDKAVTPIPVPLLLNPATSAAYVKITNVADGSAESVAITDVAFASSGAKRAQTSAGDNNTNLKVAKVVRASDSARADLSSSTINSYASTFNPPPE